MSGSSEKSLARRAPKGSGGPWLFFLLFILVGLALLYALTIHPLLQGMVARHWQKTPCVVESSRLVAHSDKSTTYRIEIIYHYVFEDRSYTSDRYSFSVGASMGRQAKANIMRRYPAGTETSCYVNPGAPEEAVIDPGWQLDFLIGGFGLLFAFAGGLGMANARRTSGAGNSAPGGVLPGTANPGSPSVLKPQHTPLTKFIGMLVFSVIWNGFIGVFVYFVFFAKDAHQAPFFAKAVILALALVGVGTVFGVLTTFLALFNPRIQITAPSTGVPLGGELIFTWTVTGRVAMLRRLKIIFEGREETTYQRGTTTTTDTQVFAELPVFETVNREFFTPGSGRVAVPATLIHTVEAGSNKVLWRLKVQGEIPNWPDVADEYPIQVLPLPLPSDR